MLTSEKKEIRYGICVIDDIIQAPSFLTQTSPGTNSNNKSSPGNSTHRDKTRSAKPDLFTRLRLTGKQNPNTIRSYAYLFITSYPFFNLYFDLAYNILGMNYI